jgi:hypothetical protein
MRLRLGVATGLVLPAILAALSTVAAAAGDVRTDLEALGAALDNAVLQVSRPARAVAQSRVGARGYRIAGFGAMFVLSPRSLPVAKPAVETASAPGPQLTNEAKEPPSSELERQMREKTARRAAGAAEPPADGEPPPAASRTLEQDLQELEQDVQVQRWLQAEAARMMDGGLSRMSSRERADYEQRMQKIHDHAEDFRARVERRRRLAEQQILQILGVPTAAAPPSGVPTTSVSVTLTPTPAPSLAVLSVTLTDEALQMRPPWSPFNQSSPTPDAGGVVRDVGVAVAQVLEMEGARLVQLPPQESVAVAIDFVPATAASTARPSRTLLVRVLKADIDARASGAIDGIEFTKRVEIVEY